MGRGAQQCARQGVKAAPPVSYTHLDVYKRQTMNTTTAQGTIDHVDPNTLTVELNVRSEAALDQDFLDSIQSNGVLTPIVGHRDAAGNIVVRAGQRRTRAAQHAGLASVPVYIVDAAQTDACLLYTSRCV